MTTEEHQARHVALHKALDELLADFIDHMPLGESVLDKTIFSLLEWSHEQTKNPTEPPKR